MNFLNWPPDPDQTTEYHVAPSGGSSANTNTLVQRKVKTYVFWASPTLIVPLTENWYVHAVSMPGSNQEFDPKTEGAARWEHFKVSADGLIDLVFSEGRTYLFYLTPQTAGKSELLNKHLPWTAHLQQTDDVPPLHRIFFPVQEPVVDDHGRDAVQDDVLNTNSALYPLVAFNSDEHLELGQSVQKLITHWALNGLVDGGAIINAGTDESPARVEDWDILVPSENSDTPYGKDPTPGKPFFWRFILPDSKNDKSEKPWTPDSLKNAVIAGNAATLSIGEIVALAGDYFESLDEMKERSPRSSINILKGFDETKDLAYMTLDVLNFRKPSKGTLNFMKKVSEDHEAAKTQINWGKVREIVTVLRKAKGPTRFSEIHTLSQMWRDKHGGEEDGPFFSISQMSGRLPWLRKEGLDRKKAPGSLTKDEWEKFYDHGFKEMFFSLVTSNGHYGDLALKNEKHFDPENWVEFEAYHKRALELIQKQVTQASKNGALHPIPAEAIALTAFGCHFLTDAFSSGHMRVPRKQLGLGGALAAKVMHDSDGRYGLEVKNGFGAVWRAFGDGNLDIGAAGRRSDSLQEGILENIKKDPGEANTDPSANRTKAIEAVGSAFKQLHYEAQRNLVESQPTTYVVQPGDNLSKIAKRFYGDPDDYMRIFNANRNILSDPDDIDKGQRLIIPNKNSGAHGTTSLSEMMKILKQNRIEDRQQLAWDGLAPGFAAEGKTLRERLSVDIPGKLNYLKKHKPEPLAQGNKFLENHPPLYNDNGSLNKAGNVYTVNDDWWVYETLHLSWHGLKKAKLNDFTSYYYLALYTQAVSSEGWLEKPERSLLDLANQLHK